MPEIPRVRGTYLPDFKAVSFVQVAEEGIVLSDPVVVNIPRHAFMMLAAQVMMYDANEEVKALSNGIIGTIPQGPNGRGRE